MDSDVKVIVVCVLAVLCGIAIYDKMKHKPFLIVVAYEALPAVTGLLVLIMFDSKSGGQNGKPTPPHDSAVIIPGPFDPPWEESIVQPTSDLPALPGNLRCQRTDEHIDCAVTFWGSGGAAHVDFHIDTTEFRLLDSDSTPYPPSVLLAGPNRVPTTETDQEIQGPNPITLTASFDGVPLTSGPNLKLAVRMRATVDTVLMFTAKVN